MMTRTKADLLLLMIALFWGFSYLLVDLCLEVLPVFELNAMRFLTAFLIAWIGFRPRLIHVTKQTIQASLLMAMILTAAYTTATFGLKYTSLSNAGFLSSLAVLFTPILLLILFRKKPSKRILFSVALSVIGIGLLTLRGDFQLAWGDILCIICSVIAGLHLVMNEAAVRKPEVDAFQNGVFQLGFSGVINLILSLVIESPVLQSQGSIWIYVVILSVFCTGVPFVIQSLAQQYTEASHVGIIYSLELVFAGIVAWIFAGEVLMIRNYIGAGLLFTSLLISVTDPGETSGNSEVKPA